MDLVDLRAASTVMRHQIITTGRRLFALNSDAERYELFILAEMMDLDHARAAEEFAKAPTIFAADFTRQDATTLNIQRT